MYGFERRYTNTVAIARPPNCDAKVAALCFASHALLACWGTLLMSWIPPWRQASDPGQEQRRALEDWVRLRFQLVASDSMIAIIGAVGRLTDAGMTIGDAMDTVLRILQEGDGTAPERPVVTDGDDPDDDARQLLAAKSVRATARCALKFLYPPDLSRDSPSRSLGETGLSQPVG